MCVPGKLKRTSTHGYASAIFHNEKLTCKNGHNLHIKAGRSHLFKSAAWNWNGIQNKAIITSAKAKFPM